MKAMSIFTAMAALALAHDAAARDQILIVGSSTVFPFATTVAESFGQSGDFKPPIIESTGTGGGMKLFCAGVGAEHPDIANASREITDSELKSCATNGVTAITEIKIGFDGIVIANNTSMPPLDVTLDQLYLALAKERAGPRGCRHLRGHPDDLSEMERNRSGVAALPHHRVRSAADLGHARRLH